MTAISVKMVVVEVTVFGGGGGGGGGVGGNFSWESKIHGY